MKLTATDVIASNKKSILGLIQFDNDLLQQVINSFDYVPTMDTVLYRYCDVVNGNTKLVGQDVILSKDSAVTELPLSPEMYHKVTMAGILTIADIDLDRCQGILTFEDYAELTACILSLGV